MAGRWAPGVNDEGEKRIDALLPSVRRAFEKRDGGVWRPDESELRFAEQVDSMVRQAIKVSPLPPAQPPSVWHAQLRTCIDHWSTRIHEWALRKGFWSFDIEHGGGKIAIPIDHPLLQSAKLALIHSEVTECLEAVRKPDVPDAHLPHVNAQALELADTVIRIFDYAKAYNLPLADAIAAKVDYNDGRPHMHGGKRV